MTDIEQLIASNLLGAIKASDQVNMHQAIADYSNFLAAVHTRLLIEKLNQVPEALKFVPL